MMKQRHFHASIRSARWLVILPAAVLSAWLAADRGQTAAIVGPGDAGPREVGFTYVARLPQIPSEAQDIRVWIPLAKTSSEQQVVRREVRSSWPSTITADPEYANEMLYLSLQRPFPPQLEVVVDYEARLLGSEAAAADRPPTRDELPRYLQASGLVIIDEEVRTRAARASRGRSTAADRARGIYEAVIRQVAYDKSVPGWGQGDTRRVCLIGKGNCTDFHSLFISMARASQIPSRFKIGIVIPHTVSGTIPGYHCWAEFYEEQQGWVPVDASEAWKHPELADHYFGARDGNRLLISVGRDIQLVPRSQRGPVNIFFYPYVEVDGQAFDGVETQLMFRELNQEEIG